MSRFKEGLYANCCWCDAVLARAMYRVYLSLSLSLSSPKLECWTYFSCHRVWEREWQECNSVSKSSIRSKLKSMPSKTSIECRWYWTWKVRDKYPDKLYRPKSEIHNPFSQLSQTLQKLNIRCTDKLLVLVRQKKLVTLAPSRNIVVTWIRYPFYTCWFSRISCKH